MNIDPAYDTQAAVFAALSNAVACPVYDEVPQNPTYPFVSLGDDQVMLGDSYQFSATTDIHVVVEIWSAASGPGEIKLLAQSVLAALNTALPINHFRVVTWEFQSTRYSRQTEQSVIYRQAIVEVKYEVQATGS